MVMCDACSLKSNTGKAEILHYSNMNVLDLQLPIVPPTDKWLA